MKPRQILCRAFFVMDEIRPTDRFTVQKRTVCYGYFTAGLQKGLWRTKPGSNKNLKKLNYLFHCKNSLL